MTKNTILVKNLHLKRSFSAMGGDLRGLGDGPPNFVYVTPITNIWAKCHITCLRPPNIWVNLDISIHLYH